MSPQLKRYLKLEGQMILLDEVAPALAEQVRDQMDPVWHELTQDDRDWLHERELILARVP